MLKTSKEFFSVESAKRNTPNTERISSLLLFRVWTLSEEELSKQRGIAARVIIYPFNQTKRILSMKLTKNDPQMFQFSLWMIITIQLHILVLWTFFVRFGVKQYRNFQHKQKNPWRREKHWHWIWLWDRSRCADGISPDTFSAFISLWSSTMRIMNA